MVIFLMKVFQSLFFIFSFSLFTVSVQAQESHLEYKNTAVLKGNPSTLLAVPELSYRFQIENLNVGLSVRPLISLSHFRPEVEIEFSPFESLQLRAGIAHGIYFESLYGFSGPTGNASDGNRARLQGNNGSANFFNLSGQLKLHFSKFIFRNHLKTSYAIYDPKNSNFVYEELLDILVAKEGWFYSNELDFLYLYSSKWVLGLRYTTSNAFVMNLDTTATHRIGPIASHVFFSNPNSTLETFSAFILLNWYMQHPFRSGQESSRLLPYSAVGFTITGSLL